MKTGSIWEEFECYVASDYRWLETPYGLALTEAEGATRVRTYRPLAKRSAGLFREFAGLTPTPEAILRFARKHGSLGYPLTHGFGAGDFDLLHIDDLMSSRIGAAGIDAVISQGQGFRGELLDQHPVLGSAQWSWKSQIAQMAVFTRWLAEGPSLDEVPLEQRGVLEEALGVVHGSEINKILAATVAPRLIPVTENGSSVRQRDVAQQRRQYQLRFEPRSLLGALWLQAAQAAADGMFFRRCPAPCGRPIAIARQTGARSDAMFCSNACRTRDLRARKARAFELKRRKWSDARIAKELRTTPQTLRGWLRAKK